VKAGQNSARQKDVGGVVGLEMKFDEMSRNGLVCDQN
jgi:hypothetical protein